MKETIETIRYTPETWHGGLAMVAFSVYAVLHVINIVIDIVAMAMLSGDEVQLLASDEVGSSALLDLMDKKDLYLQHPLIAVFTAVTFLFWIRRAHVNLYALGTADGRFSPGWSIGMFFVPIFNLFRPLQTVLHLHRASRPDLDDAEGKKKKIDPILPLWWFCTLCHFVVSRFSTGDMKEFLLSEGALFGVDALSSAFAAIALFFGALMINSIEKKQLARARQLVLF